MTTLTLRDFAVQAFFPADHAVVESGKLYVNGGGWNQLTFPTYPQVVPLSALVALLEVPFGKLNSEHALRIGMEDRDGNAQPLRVEGKFRLGAGATQEFGDPTVMPMAFLVPNLLIPKAGSYSFVLLVDGSELARFRFSAFQLPQTFNLGIAPPGAE
jgi:hypothetical protein